MNNNNSLKRLLIVDDEEMVIASIKNYLLLETDYEVLSFTSPAKALEEIREKPVSLAISDFLMPEMDGISFLKSVKMQYPKATLILLTGYADKENAIKAINELGIYKYIEKPWDNEDLKITIDNAIERHDLITELENKISELNDAHQKLELYNDELEGLVKERTKELSYTNAELKAIIESSADGILTLNSEYVITSANPAIEKYRGTKKLNIISKSLFTELNFPDSTINKASKKLDTPVLNSDCRIYNEKLARFIPVEISVAPIEHEIMHDYVVVVRDITAQKETERLREDFIATLTHDLRTPLQAAIQTLNFFLDGTLGELPEKQQKLLDTMRSSNKSMLNLVNALLEVYKYESGELRLIKDHFNFKDLVIANIEEIKSLLAKKELNIEVNLPQSVINVYGDKKELKRVLGNFLGNAINFTPSNGKITVKAFAENNMVFLTVTDTGRGIPKNDLGKLFQRFSQGTSKQRSTGTGLGLYLSRQIIEAHKGKIWATSKENSGSTFGFSIPSLETEDKNG